MATVNAWIYIPWLAYPADGMIDWNTREDYMKALEVFKEWETIKASNLPLQTYEPKSNKLTDWF